MSSVPPFETASDSMIVLQAILKKCTDLRSRITPDEIKPQTRFREDMGFDSLSLMILLYEAQEAYPHLDEQMLLTWRTPQDFLKDCLREEASS